MVGEVENLLICLLEARNYLPKKTCLKTADDIRVAQLSLGVRRYTVITGEVKSDTRTACLDCFGKIGKIRDAVFFRNCQCWSLRVGINNTDNFNQRIFEKKIEHCCAAAARTYNEYSLGLCCHHTSRCN